MILEFWIIKLSNEKVKKLKKIKIDTEKIKYVTNNGFSVRFFKNKGRPIEIAWWSRYDEMKDWESYGGKEFWYLYKKEYDDSVNDYLKSFKYIKWASDEIYYSNIEMFFNLEKMVFLDD